MTAYREPLNWTALDAMTPDNRRAYLKAWAAKPLEPIATGPDEPPLTSADRRQLLNPNSPQEWGL